MDDGKEEIQLDLDTDVYDALVVMAAERNETLDETIEFILRQLFDNGIEQ
jgi:hypothetical protein